MHRLLGPASTVTTPPASVRIMGAELSDKGPLPRPTLVQPPHPTAPTPPEIAGDIDRLITVTVYALERARAAADQAYARTRNQLTLAVTFFGLTQAAVFAGLGASVDNKAVVSPVEQTVVGVIGLLALVLLGWTARLALNAGDRGIEQRWISAGDIDRIMDGTTTDPNSTYGTMALTALQQELKFWEFANLERDSHVSEMTLRVGLVAAALVLQLVVLYTAL